MKISSLAGGISLRNRKRKFQYFMDTFRPTEKTTVLDVGFTPHDYYEGINFLEKNYPYEHNITALGIQDATSFRKAFPKVNTVIYDGKIFPFADKSFDIVWSNAVIEHVGTIEDQLLFLSECIRTGRNVFITTPNRWFPIELHTRYPFLHFLPKSIFDKLLQYTPKKWAAGMYMNLLGVSDVSRLLKKIGIADYAIKRNRLFGFTMDFVIIVKQCAPEFALNKSSILQPAL